MSCPIYSKEREIVLEYCAGSLDAGRLATFEQHLTQCGECSQMVAEQRQVWESLDLWTAPAVSDDFDARLYARIAQEAAAPAWRPWLSWQWLSRIMHPVTPGAIWKPAMSVIAAGAVLTVGLMMHEPGLMMRAPGLMARAPQTSPAVPQTPPQI